MLNTLIALFFSLTPPVPPIYLANRYHMIYNTASSSRQTSLKEPTIPGTQAHMGQFREPHQDGPSHETNETEVNNASGQWLDPELGMYRSIRRVDTLASIFLTNPSDRQTTWHYLIEAAISDSPQAALTEREISRLLKAKVPGKFGDSATSGLGYYLSRSPGFRKLEGSSEPKWVLTGLSSSIDRKRKNARRSPDASDAWKSIGTKSRRGVGSKVPAAKTRRAAPYATHSGVANSSTRSFKTPAAAAVPSPASCTGTSSYHEPGAASSLAGLLSEVAHIAIPTWEALSMTPRLRSTSPLYTTSTQTPTSPALNFDQISQPTMEDCHSLYHTYCTLMASSGYSGFVEPHLQSRERRTSRVQVPTAIQKHNTMAFKDDQWDDFLGNIGFASLATSKETISPLAPLSLSQPTTFPSLSTSLLSPASTGPPPQFPFTGSASNAFYSPPLFPSPSLFSSFSFGASQSSIVYPDRSSGSY